MAELKITLSAMDVVKEAIQDLMDGAEFKEDVSEEYKEGFYDFGNAIVKVLNEMKGEVL